MVSWRPPAPAVGPGKRACRTTAPPKAAGWRHARLPCLELHDVIFLHLQYPAATVLASAQFLVSHGVQPPSASNCYASSLTLPVHNPPCCFQLTSRALTAVCLPAFTAMRRLGTTLRRAATLVRPRLLANRGQPWQPSRPPTLDPCARATSARQGGRVPVPSIHVTGTCLGREGQPWNTCTHGTCTGYTSPSTVRTQTCFLQLQSQIVSCIKRVEHLRT